MESKITQIKNNELENNLNILQTIVNELNKELNILKSEYYNINNSEFIYDNFNIKKEILIELNNYIINIRPIFKMKLEINENNDFFKPKLKKKEKELLDKFPIISQEELESLSNLFGIKSKKINKTNEHLKIIKKYIYENDFDIKLPDYLNKYNINKIKNKFRVKIIE